MAKIKLTEQRAARYRNEHASDENAALSRFLSFLAVDMARAPERIRPFDPALSKRIRHLVKGLQNSPEENLGDEALI